MALRSGELTRHRSAHGSAAVLGANLSGPPLRRRFSPVAIAGGLTVSAGLVHAAVAPAQGERLAVAAAFVLTAAGQVVLGLLVAARPGLRRAAVSVAVLNLVVVAAWAGSRSIGLPLIAPSPEPVGFSDLAATVMELVAAGVLLLAPRSAWSLAAPARLSPLWLLAALPAVAGMAFPHDHTASHHGHDDEHAGHARSGRERLASDPIFSGADTSHASRPELEQARDLIESTRLALGRFPDEPSVVAAGYRSIGDGRRLGSFEHFVNPAYLTDGVELDPQRLESVVLQDVGSDKRVVSAMYILEVGKTMVDVPTIGGPLAVWHDHQNLCWDDSGLRLAGVLLEGRCFPGGTFRPTPPMLHVWLQDHECGPFAGIDGHGAGCGPHRHGAGLNGPEGDEAPTADRAGGQPVGSGGVLRQPASRPR